LRACHAAIGPTARAGGRPGSLQVAGLYRSARIRSKSGAALEALLLNEVNLPFHLRVPSRASVVLRPLAHRLTIAPVGRALRLPS
jgi:hypothetical protein